MKRSESVKEIAGALAKAQVQFESAIRDHTAKVQMKSGGQYSFAYADLAAYLDVCRKPLGDNGIAFLQEAIVKGREVSVTTLLIHASGESIESEPFVLSIVSRGGDGGIDPQSVGSAVTYARRYSLASLIGMASEVDDDGNRASGNKATIENNNRQQNAPPVSNGSSQTTKFVAPPPDTINKVQFDAMSAACNENSCSMNLVVAAYKVTRGSELKAADFPKIMERIKSKDPAFTPRPLAQTTVPLGDMQDQSVSEEFSL